MEILFKCWLAPELSLGNPMGWGGLQQAFPFPFWAALAGRQAPAAPRPLPRAPGRCPGPGGAGRRLSARPFFPGPLLPSVSAAARRAGQGGRQASGAPALPPAPSPRRARPGRPTETAAGGSRSRNWPGSPGPQSDRSRTGGVLGSPGAAACAGNSRPEPQEARAGAGKWGAATARGAERGTPPRVGRAWQGRGPARAVAAWSPVEGPGHAEPLGRVPGWRAWGGRGPLAPGLGPDTGSGEGPSQAKLPFWTYGCIPAGQDPTSCLSAAPLWGAAPSLPSWPLRLQLLPSPVVGSPLSVPRTAPWASLRSCAAPRATGQCSRCRRLSCGSWRA